MMIRDRIKELRRVKASDLRPSPRNWRTHGNAQKDVLRGVLAEIGMADALLARELPDGTLELIDGHCRADVDSNMTWPVLILDVTEEEANKLLVTIDPLAAMAGADAAKLDGLLKDMLIDNDAVKLMLQEMAQDIGCDFGTPAEIVEDEIPEVPKVAVTQPGDLYVLGNHRLLCGDCTIEANVTRLLAGIVPFIMVTDPPYGVDYDPKWRKDAGVNNSNRMGVVQNDTRVDWAQAYNLFPGRVAYIWHDGKSAGEVTDSLHNSKFEIRTQIVWKKTSLVMGRGHYHWQHEPCFYAVREGGSAKWCGDRKQSTIWDIANTHRNQGGEDGVTIHSTQKPIECMARPIRNHGDKGDDVYDPFLGSSTTIIAAEQLGRRCYGCEIDPRYVDVGVIRWQKLTGKHAVLEETGETFEQVAARRSAAAAEASVQNRSPEFGTAANQTGLGG